MCEKKPGVAFLKLQLARAIEDSEKLKRVNSELKVMSRMIKEITGRSEMGTCTAFGVGSEQEGLLELDLDEHFDEQKGPVQDTINFHLQRIGELLGVDWDEIEVVINWGPEGVPALPGPCDKTREFPGCRLGGEF